MTIQKVHMDLFVEWLKSQFQVDSFKVRPLVPDSPKAEVCRAMVEGKFVCIKDSGQDTNVLICSDETFKKFLLDSWNTFLILCDDQPKEDKDGPNNTTT